LRARRINQWIYWHWRNRYHRRNHASADARFSGFQENINRDCQARGGPRSVWEEKPELMNLTETKWKLRSLIANGGRKEAAAGAATFVG
jgi:hypothetical protein